MVSIPERYYVSTDGAERGPFTLSQVASMWSSGVLTSNTLYRLANIENWTPLSQLDDTLHFIKSSRPVQESDRGKDIEESISSGPAIAGPVQSSPLERPAPITMTKGAPILTQDFAAKIGQELALLQAADKLDPSGKTGKQLADSFLKQHGIIKSCWFSGREADEKSQLRVTVYQVIDRGFLSRRKSWREAAVVIPRSAAAAALHYEQTGAYAAWVVGTVLVGVILGHFIPAGSAFLFGLIGWPLGHIAGKKFCPAVPTGWKSFDEWKQHPNAIAAFHDGWTDKRP